MEHVLAYHCVEFRLEPRIGASLSVSRNIATKKTVGAWVGKVTEPYLVSFCSCTVMDGWMYESAFAMPIRMAESSNQ